MSNIIKIRKGLDIALKGGAEKVLIKTTLAATYALKPGDFQELIPKLVVQEGDAVQAGAPLFVDKHHPEIQYVSPVSGIVSAIVRGEKRKLLEVVVTPDKEQEYVNHEVSNLASMSREQIIALMLQSGVWAFLKQRPYNIVANPETTPKAIFISGFDTAPLASDIDYSLTGEYEAFQKGIDVLNKLVSKIHLGIHDQLASTSVLKKVKGVETTIFEGPHPAGNVGVQIHYISPINKGEIVWTIDSQHVVVLGRLFLKGIYDVSKIVALVGSEVKKPRYFRMIAGASVTNIADNIDTENNPRYISGNVLTGSNIGKTGHLGFYDNMITVIPEGDSYEFFGWAKPLRLNKYSFSRSYLSWIFPKKEYVLNANINGGERAFVMNGQYEKVVPMDIYPIYLLKAILAEDIDKMEQLGIYEVVEEDLALCEFICPSKIKVQEILRNGIKLMIKEM